MRDTLLWVSGSLVALAATGLAWAIRWLNRAGLEVIDTHVPDHVPGYLVQMYGR